MTTRLYGLLMAIALTVGVTLAAAPAQADAPAEADQLVLLPVTAGQNPSTNSVLAGGFRFQQHGGVPAAGTQIHVSVFSCGQFIQQATSTTNGAHGDVTVNFSPDGGLDFGENSVNKKVGPSFDYYVDIVQPGYDAYHLEGSYSGYNVKRPSCDQILGGGGNNPTGCTVKKWSKKVGQARAGSTVRVTKTKVSGCKVSYTWKANGRTVKKGKSFHLGNGMKGDKLKLIVKVKHGGTKTLDFGKVK